MRKIVLAFDSFKGSLSSIEVAGAAAKAVKEIYPDCEIVKIPVADGGEGTVESLTLLTGGEEVHCCVHDPLMRSIDAVYGILGDGKTAVIEMAAASGLPLLTSEERNPWVTSTFGTGEMILDALNRGCSRFLIGIGGSATNDAGIGMMQALGFIFRDQDGNPVEGGGKDLGRICSIDSTQVTPLLKLIDIEVACDVNNPFCGLNGAAHVYARQKGADQQMIGELDLGMSHYATVIHNHTGVDVCPIPGAGAAGGLGGAFVSLLQARLKPGIRMVLDAIGFDERIADADLIFTGEGRMDEQTCMGKTPSGVLHYASHRNIPVIALGGSIEATRQLNDAGFLAVLPVQPAPVSLEKAMEKEFAQKNISRTVLQLMRLIRYFKH